MTINRKYFIEHAADTWGFVDACIDDDGTLTSMQVDGTRIEIKTPCVYSGYDGETNTAFWLAISENNVLYRLNYNGSIKTAPSALPLSNPNGKRVKREQVLPVTQFPEGMFNQVRYESIRKTGAARHEKIMRKIALQEAEPNRKPAELLNESDLSPLEVRVADRVQRMQADGGVEDVVYTETRAFQKKADDAYVGKVQAELLHIISAHPNNYSELKDALKDYLKNHWKAIKGTPLSYTALPNHPVTTLLLEVAKKLSELEGEHAISYLMPDVYTDSQFDNIQSLDEQTLLDVLKTHILDESGHYLLPVSLLLDYTGIPGDGEESSLKDGRTLYNPYYDACKDPDESRQHLTDKDIERLFQHSSGNQALRSAYEAFKLESSDDKTLLGQLNHLVGVLKFNDAHGGIGREGDVGEAVYTIAPEFLRYYRRLDQVGLHVCEDGMPSLAEAFGSKCNMGYILVKSGAQAGLHFLSRYNEDGSLREAGEPDRETYQAPKKEPGVYEETRKEIDEPSLPLCDVTTTVRYPIDVMVCEAFSDTPGFRATLSDKHPTLIRVLSEERGNYSRLIFK